MSKLFLNLSKKSDLLNKHFSSKSSVPNADDDVPFLPRNPNIPSVCTINTSPMEVSKIIRDHLKKSHLSHCGIPGKFLSIY